MNRSISIAIAVLLGADVCAQQNLVPNGSFEGYCPDLNAGGAEIWHVQPWNNIVNIGGGADAYNSCAEPLIVTTDTLYIYGVPENGVGFQLAHSGDGYAGFYAVSDPESYPDWREFIQTPLMEPLQSGFRYEVVFHVNLADKFQYAVGSLGVHFSVNPLHEAAYDILPDVTPQIQSPVGVTYDDKENWMEVRDTIVIRGGEDGQQWMTIGNFLSDSLSQITFVDSGFAQNYDRSYYYIDDVSVIALDSVPDGVSEMETIHLSVYPNPSSQFVQIHTRSFMHMLRLLDIRGREVMVREVGGRKHTLELGDIPSGMYFLEVTDNEGRMATERIIKPDGP
jgi:hypothetical protein